MSKNDSLISRRGFCAGAAAAGLVAPFGAARAQGAKYPSRTFSVVIPTGQGGGAALQQFLARPLAGGPVGNGHGRSGLGRRPES